METTNNRTSFEQDDLNFLRYAWELEREWKQQLRREFPRTEADLIDIFHPPPSVLKEKISEWESERDKVVKAIQRELLIVRAKTKDEFSRWFWRRWIGENGGEKLVEIDKQIMKLKRLLLVRRGQTLQSKNGVTAEQIELSLTVPIENFIDQPLRVSGNKLVGLCPFHNEKTPSFFVYPNSNTFYCYGCNRGGNAINFIRALRELTFVEAVKMLINL